MPTRVGVSNIIGTNGTAPGALTPDASTGVGDLLLWFGFIRGTGGNETMAAPSGFTTPAGFPKQTTSGTLCFAWRIRTTGDTTYTPGAPTNVTTGTSGESILTWIETWYDHNPTTPVLDSADVSTWASSNTLGPVGVTNMDPVPVNGAVVVFAGKFENSSSQTVTSGNSLDWTTGTLADTTQGSDASAITQLGENNTTSSQSVTSKSITTAGTAGIGSGTMIVLNPPPAGTVCGVWPEANNRIGPFKDSSGNLYTVTEFHEPTPRPCIRKSHDGGDTWLEKDQANRPTNEDLESLWLQEDTQTAGLIHMVWQRSSSSYLVYYASFGTSDHATTPDVWITRNETVHTPVTVPDNQSCALVQRTTNRDLFAFYRGDAVSGFQRQSYRKKTGATGAWGSNNEVDTTASTAFTQVQAVMNIDGETIHVIYKDDTNNAIYHKSINSSDTLSGRTLVSNTNVSTDNQTMPSPPVVQNLGGGSQRIWITYKRSTDSLLMATFSDDAGSTWSTPEVVTDVAVYEDPIITTSEQTVATLVNDPDTNKLYVPYADNSTHDLQLAIRNGAWGTDTELVDAADVQFVNGNIFTHSAGNGGAKVLGMIYDDLTNVAVGVPRYTEYTLPAVAVPVPDVIMPPMRPAGWR